MRAISRRHRTIVVGLLVATTVGLATPAATSGHAIPGFNRFMNALAKVESGGRYDARNPSSGAFGKYQIMPASWRAWARQVLGNPNAPQTAANQERVARFKVHERRHRYGSWELVAYWWLTGRANPDRSEWSHVARIYVDKVMTAYRGGAGASSSRFAVQETYRYIRWSGTWSTARHGAYQNDRVRWSSRPGATATLPFRGRSIAWIGPKGPTRGKARVSIDGRYVRTVDLYRGSFRATDTLFSHAWGKVGRHTITIEVLGTAGRPVVAIDAFRVGR